MRARGRERWRRLGLMAGALAFLFQMLTTTLLMPPAAQAGDSMVICTADGMATVTLDAQGKPVSPDTPHDGACDGCLNCFLCGTPGALPPSMALAPPVEWVFHGAEALPGSHIAAGWFLSSLQARAPPITG